jgi:hypothetical protein
MMHAVRVARRYARTSLVAIVLATALTAVHAQPAPPPARRTDLVALDMGGRIERVSSNYDRKDWDAINLLGTLPLNQGAWSSADVHLPNDFPQDVVMSFFGREPALVAAVVIDLHTRNDEKHWAKDVEIWTSMNEPDTTFTKVAQKTLADTPGDQTISFTPVQARFVKVRATSNWGDPQEVQFGRIKVIEGKATGYKAIVDRNPDLAALVKGDPLDKIFKPEPGPAAAASVKAPGPTGPTCDAASIAPPPVSPKHHQSQGVLVLHESKTYAPFDYEDRNADRLDPSDAAVYQHVTLTRIDKLENVRPAMLLPEDGYDTVVLSQVCDTSDLPADFRKALSLWVAGGHKLIIQDADACEQQPDYSFLPYKLVTSNPGAKGASSDRLILVEEDSIANSHHDDPAFLDIPNWLASASGNHNELGDSNTIKQYDANWCGSLFGTNVLHVNGFMEAYAHIGGGLVVYDGFDVDQEDSPAYRRLVTRELAQSFDPDGLPCTERLGDFVMTTDQKLKVQPMAPGRTYAYPLTLLSNQGYKGQIKLSATVSPGDPSFSTKFAPDSVALTEIASDAFTVTTTAATPAGPHTIFVRGTDAAGKSNAICLALTERTGGGLRIDAGSLTKEKRSKNLEIILDESGSMKLPLGKSTRIATAKAVLKDVLTKLPDDLNVGLRVYANRYASRDKRTCTDTQLVAPIEKLDRGKISGIVNGTTPRGETPLVYSVMQAADDLKAKGGGSIVLVTDGEESCGGDPVAAGQKLKASGIDATLDIVGFTLTGQQVAAQLTKFAEATGGHYYTAQNQAALSSALTIATLDKLPFTAYDAAGKAVASGEVGGESVDLPPGQYKIVVNAGDLKATANGVVITKGKDTTLTLGMKGGALALGSAGGNR